MPAHMDTPLDFTYPAWYHADGTARTIRSGAPSISSAAASASSRAASSRAPSIAPSTSTKSSTGTSASASRTRARGPRELRAKAKDTEALVHVHAHSAPVAPAAEPRETPATPLTEPVLMSTPTSSQLRRSEQARRFRAVPRGGYARATATLATAPPSGSPHTTSRAIEPTGHPTVHKTPPLADNLPIKAEADPDVVEQLRRWEAMHAAALRASSPESSSSHGASPAPTPAASALPASVKNMPVLRTVARDTPRSITPSARREHSQAAVVHAETGTAPRAARRREGERERGGAATVGAHGRRNEAWAAPRRDVDAEIAPGESWYRPAPKKARAGERKGGKTVKGPPAAVGKEEGEKRGLVAAIVGWF